MRFLSFLYWCSFIFLFRFFFTLSAHSALDSSSPSETGFGENPNAKLGKITSLWGEPKGSVTGLGWNMGRCWTSTARGKRRCARGSTCEPWKEAMILVAGEFLSSFLKRRSHWVEACLFIIYFIVVIWWNKYLF